ncbi:hypothetical protein H5410_003087 [Solanum commersonii]|uniref:Polyprotein protein n=1 Tax=Solanum commersonii TaxID=4109 RepID=A0A9J6B453_SOLCO|nr:hypothetical protein H5410_003087 [Solanum commersonii]
MIERDITAALTPLQASNDALTMRVVIFERGQGVTTEVTTLKAEIPNNSSTEIPTRAKVPWATTGDDIIEDVFDAEFEAETNEEQLEERDKIV